MGDEIACLYVPTMTSNMSHFKSCHALDYKAHVAKSMAN